MAVFKEIVTKAVIGKAKKTSKTVCEITPEITPDTILGCWVINHEFSGLNSGGNVKVNGSFDVNVWYSYDNNTKTSVITDRFSYNETMNMTLKDNSKLTNNSEIIVRSLKQPTVTDVNIDNGVVKMNVEKELGIEIVGDTMVKVSVEEDEDDYEVLEDETTLQEEETKEIDEVTTDYLK